MADTKLSALTELDATPATGDELYIRDVSEATADESKRITIANLVAAAGPSQAVQSDIEAETNEDTYVPPDLLRHHPGVAKAWANVTSAGGVGQTHNVASTAKNSTGNYTVTLTTAVTSTDWPVSATASGAGDNTATGDGLSTTTYRVLTYTAGTLTDLASHSSIYGDH